MGEVKTKVRVGKESVEAFVDTGATFSTFPERILRKLKAKAERKVKLKLADGSTAVKRLCTICIEVEGRSGLVPALFGNGKSPILLGYTALEILGFGVDPTRRRLVPKEYFEQF